jgi:hypothetical protein
MAGEGYFASMFKLFSSKKPTAPPNLLPIPNLKQIRTANKQYTDYSHTVIKIKDLKVHIVPYAVLNVPSLTKLEFSQDFKWKWQSEVAVEKILSDHQSYVEDGGELEMLVDELPQTKDCYNLLSDVVDFKCWTDDEMRLAEKGFHLNGMLGKFRYF